MLLGFWKKIHFYPCLLHVIDGEERKQCSHCGLTEANRKFANHLCFHGTIANTRLSPNKPEKDNTQHLASQHQEGQIFPLSLLVGPKTCGHVTQAPPTRGSCIWNLEGVSEDMETSKIIDGSGRMETPGVWEQVSAQEQKFILSGSFLWHDFGSELGHLAFLKSCPFYESISVLLIGSIEFEIF